MKCEVSDIGFRTIPVKEDEDGDLRVSIKATVRNNTDDDEVRFHLQGVDKDGFALTTVIVEGHVPIGRSRVLTEWFFVRNSILQEIVDWQQK